MSDPRRWSARSNLLLARAGSRRHEAALRTALGATRSRLLGQFLAESMVLAMAGGGLGAVVAYVVGSSFAALVLLRMESVVSGSVTGERFRAVTVGLFAGAALLLAAMGVYGVLARSKRT